MAKSPAKDPRRADGPEPGPSGLSEVERFEADISHFSSEAEQFKDNLMRSLNLSEDRVIELALVFFGRSLDLTTDPNKVVLVVKGEVDPYDNALQALVLDDREEDVVRTMLLRWAAGLADRTE